MATLKECQVIKLSTGLPVSNKVSHLTTHNGRLFTNGEVIGEYINHDAYLIEQHLYGVSDKLPNEGEWCINPEGRLEVFGYDYRAVYSKEAILTCKRVIASTNKHLSLPFFSTGFIQKYCQLGGIDKVMVEYEQWEMYHQETTRGGAGRKYLTPVVRKDNTIITKPIKDSWTREEVIELRKQAYIKGVNIGDEAIDTDDEDFESFINNF